MSASGVTEVEPPDPAFAATIARLPPVQQWSIYRGLRADAQVAYLSSGIDLDALGSKVEDIAPGREDVGELITATAYRLHDAMAEDSGAEFWRAHLWRMCGRQHELVELLRSEHFISLRPEAAFWLIHVANIPRWNPAAADAEWRELWPRLQVIVDVAATEIASEYQRKFVEDMAGVYWWTLDRGNSIGDALAKCLALCRRIARPPFATRSSVGFVLQALGFVHLPWGRAEERDAVREAPESSWLALENACKRRNQTHLVARGFERLSLIVPSLLASTFVKNPAALIETAVSLAAVSFASAEALLREYVKSALADDAVEKAPVEELCALIDPVARAGGPNPIRRALREHLDGTKRLSDEQLRGHRERILDDLGIVRLVAIRQAVERTLAARIGAEKIETANMRHALGMLTDAERQTRQLRRMLTATAAGNANWRREHPRTKEWLARHPKLDPDVWTQGIEMHVTIEGYGEVCIAVEKDLLEALKLGTYVGSCLGHGGNYESSAAAVVLDFNKQVVYARDARGTVIGRQLIAFCDDDRLVCFYVYGSAKRELMEPHFRELDRAFAARLGVPLFTSGGYNIESILSHDWYDDGAWQDD